MPRHWFAWAVLVVWGFGTATQEGWAQDKQNPGANSATQPPKWEEFLNVNYVHRDSGPLKADLFVPQGRGPFPAVVVIHGGGWRSGDKWQLRFIARRLAGEGFVAMCIQYRLAPEHKFPAQLEDCQQAVLWLRKHAQQYKVDPRRVAVWGYSAGAHLAALLGWSAQGPRRWDHPDGTPSGAKPLPWQVQAVVGGGTPADLRLFPPQSRIMVFLLGATRAENPRIYNLASPQFWISADDPPTLFYHGTRDRLVRISQARRAIQQLQQLGVKAQMVEIPDRGHIAAALDPRGVDAGVKFLQEVLQASSQKPAK